MKRADQRSSISVLVLGDGTCLWCGGIRQLSVLSTLRFAIGMFPALSKGW